MKQSFFVAALSLLVMFSLAFMSLPCSGFASVSSADSVPSLEELKNMTYTGFEEPKDPVTLVDGRWEGKPYAEGGGAKPEIRFVRDFRRMGDVDGDGKQEAIVLLNQNTGGSGTFTYLAVVKHKDGKLKNIATAFLGDRIQIRDGRVEGGRILLDLVQAGAEDAACCPGELVTQGWELQTQGLKALPADRKSGRLSLETIEGTEWILRSWNLDESAPTNPQVTLMLKDGKFVGTNGCNRYFIPVEEGKMPGDISVGLGGSTRMACPEPAMAVETRFMTQLSGVKKFGFMAGQLALSYQKDDVWGVMLFDKRKP